MDNVQNEKINRNEERINKHSTRIKHLEIGHVELKKDVESFGDAIKKLNESIDKLNDTVTNLQLIPNYTEYEVEQLNKNMMKLTEQVDLLSAEDGEKWKYYSKLALGLIITSVIAYFLGGI